MYNAYVGIYKFILSILVVAIHVEPFTGDLQFYVSNYLARIAVPSFFVLSAYFLFDKLLQNNWDKKIFIKNQKHLLKYYGLWLLLHAPIVIINVQKESSDTLDFVWKLFQAVTLKGPYGALWFLPATIMAVSLVYFFGKKFGPNITLFISFPLFFFAALETEYFGLIKDIVWMEKVNAFLVAIFGWLANGLTFGFFFCAIGFFIAYNKNKKRNLKLDLIAGIISFILVYVETTIVRDYKLAVSYGAMLFLVPTVYFFVQVLLNAKATNNLTTIRISKYLQNLSLLIYPMHFAIMELMEYLLRNNKTYMESTTIQFICVTAITCTISFILIYLGEQKNIKLAKAFYGK